MATTGSVGSGLDGSVGVVGMVPTATLTYTEVVVNDCPLVLTYYASATYTLKEYVPGSALEVSST